MDAKPNTFWHTQWQGAQPGHPHHLVIDLGKQTEIMGINYLPRQDMDHGRVRDFRFC